MQLSVLRRLRDLVKAGAVVTGQKPERSLRMLDDDAEFKTIVAELWGTAGGVHKVGAGRVYAATPLADVLREEKIAPDFEHSRPQADTALLFVHRTVPGAEIYWVNNRRQRAETVDATFRVVGKAPEVWDPVSGVMTPASYKTENGRTVMPLRLESDDALFVVFRTSASSPSRSVPDRVTSTLSTLEGPWTVSFQPDRGAPATATFDRLASWSDNQEVGIKYFSGTATYTRTIDVSGAWLQKGIDVWLDLGDVKNLAAVTVNGKAFQPVWRPPFRVNISPALNAGSNELQVAVTNLWVNRVVGDLQPGVTRKVTYTPMPFYKPDSPLLPSGLLGPVTVLKISTP
jgi:hypothetical protein